MRWLRALGLVAIVVAGAIAAPRRASAQCTSSASTCVNCHEVQGLRPVLTNAQPWHEDHAFADLCASCHRGDPTSDSQSAAHAGMCDPLDAPDVICAGCHERDAVDRAERYRTYLFDNPPPPPGPPAGPTTTGTTHASHGTSGAAADRVLAAAALALAAVLALLLTRPRMRLELGRWLRAGRWSPYVAGAGLGVVVAIAEVGFGRPIAAAGAFDRLAAYPGRALFPSSTYYAYVMKPQISWQVWLMVGLLLGAFASSRAAGQARLRWLPDAQWRPRFGPSRTLRLALAFVGAALVQIGAGIAGGCTSGLAISGGAALAPAAFVFMAGMFAGGIPAAWLWYRGRPS